jgi:isoamylase
VIGDVSRPHEEEQLVTTDIQPGSPYPIGATPGVGGVNFSVFADKADAVELLFFDRVDGPPTRVIRLDPPQHRTCHYWHVLVPDARPGQIYAYRASGPDAPERGLCYDADKVLLDPYGRAVAVPASYNRDAARRPGDNAATAMKNVVADTARYDWEDDQPLRRPIPQTVIYEMHVGGFTRHPSSGVTPEKRGTYAGLVEKIPYLRELGITAVELLPVFQFDPSTAPPGLVNYWGYQPISFFAPHAAYSSRHDPLGVLDEFRDMVKALHRAGIEVILDVVYNHTAEAFGGHATLSFRGLANDAYYILDAADRSQYIDCTGCGNTLDAGSPVVRRLTLDSLRYWVQEMHVDGFRFDLASVLTRDSDGRPLPNPPVIWDIDSDPVLAGSKLIAEAWDAAGLYQVGAFVGDAWKEWNGRFRDDVRGFVKSDNDSVRKLALRLTGSPDIYGSVQREPERSINFVTVHDGFTLNDLVSYSGKHNEANGEDNRDGSGDNGSWNCGVEGPTDNPEVEALRNRQVKNFFALLLASTGGPLILMGDEVRRTQAGNNNAYCQDNEISWFDWGLLERHGDIHRFVKMMIASRLHYGEGRSAAETLPELLKSLGIEFHGVSGGAPDESATSHTLAMLRKTFSGREWIYLMCNAYWEPLDFVLPALGAPTLDATEAGWQVWIDTTCPSPDDIHNWDQMPSVTGTSYRVGPRSVVALVAKVKT